MSAPCHSILDCHAMTEVVARYFELMSAAYSGNPAGVLEAADSLIVAARNLGVEAFKLMLPKIPKPEVRP